MSFKDEVTEELSKSKERMFGTSFPNTNYYRKK